MADLGAAQVAVAKMFGLAAGEREHLRRFIKFLKTGHALSEGLHDSDSLLLSTTSDEIIDRYIEWLKAGEPE